MSDESEDDTEELFANKKRTKKWDELDPKLRAENKKQKREQKSWEASHADNDDGEITLAAPRKENEAGIIATDTPFSVWKHSTMNGRRGAVVAWHRRTGTYSVLLNPLQEDGEKEHELLERSCILQTPEVTITGLLAKPELNGRQASLISSDENSGRFRVQLLDHNVASREASSNAPEQFFLLKMANLRLPKGVCVAISGLKKGAKHNGTWGTIIGRDEEAGRYSVQIQDQQTLGLKFENCGLS